MGPGQRGRAVACPHPVEPDRRFSFVGPGSIAVGREEALRTLVPRRFDRAHGRLSALLFDDEKVPGVPFQILGRMAREGPDVAATARRTAKGRPASAEEGTPPSERI